MADTLALWDKLGKVQGTIADRIVNRVATEPNTGCWLWLGAVSKSGYGTMTVSGHTAMAHRASYTAFNGAIPAGLHIDHKCKVRSCVNPQHLEAVTPAENNRRSPRSVTLVSHCIHGHPFSGDNVRWDGRQRRCRTCDRDVALASYHRRKATK